MPGPVGLPVLGNLLEVIRQDELFYFEMQKRYGNIFKVYLPMYGPIACLIGPDANRLVLKDAAGKLSSRSGNKTLSSILGPDFVLMQDGDAHRSQRKMLLPIFHHQAIASYFDLIQTVVDESLTQWATGEYFDLNPAVRKLTLTIVVKTVLGSSKTEEVDQVCEWFNILIDSLYGIVKWDVPFTLHGKGQAARRKIEAYARQLIQERQPIANPDTDVDQPSTDLISLLMAIQDESGQPYFTETQLVNQVTGFLFAGHETTATLINWLIFELSDRAEWRERLLSELEQVTDGQPLQVSHLRQLNQMSNVLKEGERLYPPAQGICRGVVEDIEYGGYRIPSGWSVLLLSNLTHRMPEIFANPDRFDPDRFATPREEDKQHSFSLIGFGGGAHSCLGIEFARMEMMIILATLLRQYDWEITPTSTELSPVLCPYAQQKRLKVRLLKRSTIPTSSQIKS